MITTPATYSLLAQNKIPPTQSSREEYKSQKDLLMEKLQLKNGKLKAEIYKIQVQIQIRNDIQRDQGQSVLKRQSLFNNDNGAMLEQQLQNAYKSISLYEYQIRKLQDDPNKMSLQAKRSQTEVIIRQKKEMFNKLKDKYTKQLKVVQDNHKKLKDTNLKQTLDEQIVKINNQVRMFKERVVGMQRNQQIKKESMTRQYKAIKKMENQLLQMGMVSGTLEDLKNKALKGIGVNNSDQKESRNNSIQQIPSQQLKNVQKNMKNNSSIRVNGHVNINSSRSMIQQYEQSPQKQNYSYQNYKKQTNQLSLLDKVVSDYEKMIKEGQIQKQAAIKLNQQSKHQLNQCQKEIQRLEQELVDLKGKINPDNMKPLKQLRSMTTRAKENPAKINQSPLLVKMPAIVKNKSISHLLKFDQIGFPSQKGQKFTDRLILGRSNLKARILGAKLYISRASGMIIGLQITYSGNKKGGDYFKKQIPQQLYTKQQFQCTRPNYIKNLQGTLNTQGKLQSIIFISSNKIQYKFGPINTKSKKFLFQMQQQEYPTCLYGSLIIGKQNKKDISFIQYLGIQIQRQEQRIDKK